MSVHASVGHHDVKKKTLQRQITYDFSCVPDSWVDSKYFWDPVPYGYDCVGAKRRSRALIAQFLFKLCAASGGFKHRIGPTGPNTMVVNGVPLNALHRAPNHLI
jgi:hypothetical protein